ncbi:MAG TPA: hypothetical protein RMH99_27365, partial [Sandaracinaceae bacterium LLY-WYZ-13_1]|nr:hypothetical protein [Sandaracinaceae bacterium LLY-WYZ-13_1]
DAPPAPDDAPSDAPPAPDDIPSDAPSAPAAGDGRAWESIVSAIMDAKPALGAVLQHGVPVRVSAEAVVLGFPRGSFFGEQARALDAKEAIARSAANVLGAEPRVEVTSVDASADGAKTLVEAAKERRDARIEATRQKALNHPIVLEAAQLFRVAPERMTVRVELE